MEKKRYIFIGDIHGCYDEIIELLSIINPRQQDEIYCTGDFLDRGPNPDKCVELWRKNGYKAVLGNHDKRLIDWYNNKTVTYAEDFDSTIRKFQEKPYLVEYLSGLPYIIDIPDINVLLVHAAINLNLSIIENKRYANERKFADIFLRGRYVNFNESYEYKKLGKENKTDKLWYTYWNNDYTIIYGHTPHCDFPVLVGANTYGIDGGGVYGGYFTALIYEVEKGWYYKAIQSKKKYWKQAESKDIVII